MRDPGPLANGSFGAETGIEPEAVGVVVVGVIAAIVLIGLFWLDRDDYGRHAGAGPGALSVWQIRATIVADRRPLLLDLERVVREQRRLFPPEMRPILRDSRSRTDITFVHAMHGTVRYRLNSTGGAVSPWFTASPC